MTPLEVYIYSRDVVKCRRPDLEPIILTSEFYSLCYAKYIIKDRWPEAEPVIKQKNYFWEIYCCYFKIKKVNWKNGF